jgi:hypothetical protein
MSEPEEGQVHLFPTIQLASFAPRCIPFTPVYFFIHSFVKMRGGRKRNDTRARRLEVSPPPLSFY